MYEGVHVFPDGETTVARYALTAQEYGFDGIVVRAHESSRTAYDRDAIRERYGVDVVEGIEIDVEDPERASGYLGNYRPDYTVVAVTGGSVSMNRFAVEQPKVDVLADPMAGDGDINHVMAKAAVEHGVRIEYNLGPVLRTSGGSRVQYLSDLRKLRELIDQFEVPYVVTANPKSHRQLRTARELRALGEVLGIDEEWIEAGLDEWHRLADRNRTRQSESFIEPGVRRGRYETDN